jgi:predicted MFS family arabinose efflux permease
MLGIGIGTYMLINALGYIFTDKISRYINVNKFLLSVLAMGSIVWISLYFVNVWIAMFIIFIFSFFSAIKGLLIDHEVNVLAPSSHRATILSVKNMGVNLVYAISAPFLGLITDVYNIRTTVLSVGIGLFIFLIFCLILFRKDLNSNS